MEKEGWREEGWRKSEKGWRKRDGGEEGVEEK